MWGRCYRLPIAMGMVGLDAFPIVKFREAVADGGRSEGSRTLIWKIPEELCGDAPAYSAAPARSSGRNWNSRIFMLPAIGGVGGVVLAFWGVDLLKGLFPSTIANLAIPRMDQIHVDAPVLAFALVLSLVTGIAFGAAGLTNSISAIGYTAVTRRIGYVRMLTMASVLLAVTIGALAVAPNAVVVVIAVGAAGLLYGAIVPATASMIGLETPIEAQSTVFGFNASAVAFGFFLGPLIGGGIAAATSEVRIALAVTALFALGLAVLVGLGTREPRVERS